MSDTLFNIIIAGLATFTVLLVTAAVISFIRAMVEIYRENKE